MHHIKTLDTNELALLVTRMRMEKGINATNVKNATKNSPPQHFFTRIQAKVKRIISFLTQFFTVPKRYLSQFSKGLNVLLMNNRLVRN
ncbi:MAG: hypothetical protein C4617_03235 [Candidatus Liberibacter europaeus]|uniref:Uncharacterized protein n=1 Tax=Candidatus Liberibacter europaeus TaxID=744859 RepID=A0A2T4VYH6_9HYPH|nr:hypothetical protein [Candidatus Liberibacter europaeus]PTL86821.1 MAG: hypothetical protein C4617_03235 [Candidatus Liberibacter europaeus]